MGNAQNNTYQHCSFKAAASYSNSSSTMSKSYFNKEKEIINNRNIESKKISAAIKMTDKKYHQAYSL